MIITDVEKNDYKQIRSLWDECFQEDSIEWRNWYFKNIYNADNAAAVKNDNKLVSMVHMNPYPICLHGVQINAFALSGVATKQKHRGQGYAGDLIRYALNKAYRMRYDFSFLYPFKYSYYEKFGYKLGYNKYMYNAEHKKCNDVKIKVCDMFSTDKFQNIYNKFISDKNGYVIRNSDYYKIHINELLCDNKIVCFSIDDKYGYFAINNDGTVIEELAYEGELSEAIMEIPNYLNRDIIFKNLYDDDSLENIIEPHCMARVISVQGIFNKIVCKDADIKIKITDDIIEENNGVFHIFSKNGSIKTSKTQQNADCKIDVSMLAPILLGYELEDKDATEIQRILFDKNVPFIYEVC